MFRFIHTADVHLDSPLKSLALRNPELADLIGVATRRAFERVIDLCLDEQVNALVIAGDLYDGDLRSMNTAAFLGRQMRRLDDAGVRVFMVRGNHDSESTITRYLDLPSNVHVFTGRGGGKELNDLGVAIHGVSFARRHAPESLLPKYRPPIPGLVNIGIMHTSLAGAAGHDDYSPCAVSDLSAHGFQYWALGHIHQRQVHEKDPFVVMPGIPQGRDIGEDGSKSVTLVEVTDAGIRLEERVVAIAEFCRAPVDLTAVEDWQDALVALRTALELARDSAKAEHTICRVELEGKSSLGWRLRRDADLLNAEARDAAQQLGDVWIDRIDYQIEPPAPSTSLADPVDELVTLMKEVAEDGGFRAEAASYLDQIVRALPAELRDRYGNDPRGTEAVLERLLTAGAADVIAELKGGQTEREAS